MPDLFDPLTHEHPVLHMRRKPMLDTRQSAGTTHGSPPRPGEPVFVGHRTGGLSDDGEGPGLLAPHRAWTPAYGR
jgi:hypothetical protein